MKPNKMVGCFTQRWFDHKWINMRLTQHRKPGL
jgi:hypothetical protein